MKCRIKQLSLLQLSSSHAVFRALIIVIIIIVILKRRHLRGCGGDNDDRVMLGHKIWRSRKRNFSIKIPMLHFTTTMNEWTNERGKFYVTGFLCPFPRFFSGKLEKLPKFVPWLVSSLFFSFHFVRNDQSGEIVPNRDSFLRPKHFSLSLSISTFLRSIVPLGRLVRSTCLIFNPLPARLGLLSLHVWGGCNVMQSDKQSIHFLRTGKSLLNSRSTARI